MQLPLIIRSIEDAKQALITARSLISNSPESQRFANDPDAQAKYIDETVYQGMNLALDPKITFPENLVVPQTIVPERAEQPSIIASAPIPNSIENRPTQPTALAEEGYANTFVNAIESHLDHNPGEASVPRFTAAIQVGLNGVMNEHPEVSEETLTHLAELAVDHLQPQVDAVAAVETDQMELG